MTKLGGVRCCRTPSEQGQRRLGISWNTVPVYTLFENLKDGASIEQFLEWFPGVEGWEVEAVLDHEMKALAASARS